MNWTAVDNATGYTVQWKSGAEAFNTGDRQATVASGSTTSHTIGSLANDTEYTVQVIATRTGANDGPPSAEVKATPVVPTAPGVTVSESTLTVTEEDSTGDSYTVALDTLPTADVTVTVAGHASTDVTLSPTTLTFTTLNWETAQTVTVTAANDADTTNDTVTLTHSATSTDADYNAISIDGVTVTVNDNDTAQVMDVEITPGDAELVVEWTAVDNATGYTVQWKSGVEAYNTGDRQATVTSGSTTSHTISSLTNGTEYTVQVIATRTGANDGPPSVEVKSTPTDPTNNVPVFTLATESVGPRRDAGRRDGVGGGRRRWRCRCHGRRQRHTHLQPGRFAQGPFHDRFHERPDPDEGGPELRPRGGPVPLVDRSWQMTAMAARRRRTLPSTSRTRASHRLNRPR